MLFYMLSAMASCRKILGVRTQWRVAQVHEGPPKRKGISIQVHQLVRCFGKIIQPSYQTIIYLSNVDSFWKTSWTKKFSGGYDIPRHKVQEVLSLVSKSSRNLQYSPLEAVAHALDHQGFLKGWELRIPQFQLKMLSGKMIQRVQRPARASAS